MDKPRIVTKKDEYDKLRFASFEEPLKDGERRMFVIPGYDYRGGIDRRFGQHGAELVFALRRGKHAVHTSIFTGWNVNDESFGRPMCTGIYYHYGDKKKLNKDIIQYAYHKPDEPCVYTDGKCWGLAGNALHGDTMMERLINEGSPAIWDELDKALKEIEDAKGK